MKLGSSIPLPSPIILLIINKLPTLKSDSSTGAPYALTSLKVSALQVLSAVLVSNTILSKSELNILGISKLPLVLPKLIELTLADNVLVKLLPSATLSNTIKL